MMRGVARKNERLRETGGHVIDWMFGNYVLAAGMSFRRDLDRDSSTLGMLNLLYEIEERPTIVNRERYRLKWGVRQGDRIERHACDDAFDTFEPVRIPETPERDHMNPAIVSADRQRLLANTETVRLVVEQTFAHRARSKPEQVTWGDFHTALDALVEVFTKYYALLTQKTLVSIEPTAQYDAHECLTFPWLQAER